MENVSSIKKRYILLFFRQNGNIRPISKENEKLQYRRNLMETEKKRKLKQLHKLKTTIL